MPRRARAPGAEDVITLFDLGAEYWRNYFATKSPIKAYEYTFDRIGWYRERSDRGRFIVCCDSPRSARREKHPAYKANREKKDPAAVDSLRALQECLAELGLKLCLVDGWEGDDIIATLTRQAWPEEVEIIGSEKDFFCLIDDDRVHLIGKNGAITSRECFEKWRVPPSQMTEFLALVGDESDNIPGCPNCGPGRAAKLLERFGTLAEIKAAVSSGALQKGVLRGIGETTLASLHAWDPTQALELVTMNDQLPISLVQLLG